MNDSECLLVFAPKIKDCIVCTQFDPVWEGDGDSDDEEIVYYCHVQGFKDNHGFAKPTKREVCDQFEMRGERTS